MKKTIKVILFLISACSATAQPYGEILYSHDVTSKLTSGAVMTNSPGVLIAGCIDSSQSFNRNFYIDRTNAGGIFAGSPWEFQKKYQMSGFYCDCGPGTGGVNIYRCGTVKAIETTLSTYPYAIAGTLPHGFFFCLLNPNGTPGVFSRYVCPGVTHAPSRDLQFIESVTNPGDFFVCMGSSIGEMYVERVNSAGSVASFAFDNSSGDLLVPHAMIESPYSTDITIVGTSIGSDNDGFLVQLDQNLTAVTNFWEYNDSGADEEFHSIEIASSTIPSSNGFIIGGSYIGTAAGSLRQPLFVKVDPTGVTVIWNTRIAGTYDAQAGPVQAVFERLNGAVSPAYEYYGTSTSSVGIVVYKLDGNGVPWQVSHAFDPDEYLYNVSGSSIASTKAMTHKGTGPSDRGIQIFGNDEGCFYFTEAYYSGHSGCQNRGNISSYSSPGIISANSLTSAISTQFPCAAFSISSSNDVPFNQVCGPANTLPAPASNLRTTNINENEYQTARIGPIPANNYLEISGLSDGDTMPVVSLKNLLGESITVPYQLLEKKGNNLKVNIEPLNLPNGIYLLDLGGSILMRQSIIISK